MRMRVTIIHAPEKGYETDLSTLLPLLSSVLSVRVHISKAEEYSGWEIKPETVNPVI